MSTSLLYHAFGIIKYFYQSTRFIAGASFLNGIDRSKVVYIELPVQRVKCIKCKTVRQVKIRLAGEHKRYTRAFERLVQDHSRQMTIQSGGMLSWGELGSG